MVAKSTFEVSENRQEGFLRQASHDSAASKAGEFVRLVSKEMEIADGASTLQTIFNLVKSIVGAGVLSLSANMGAGTGVAPAVILAVLLGSLSAYTFSLVGRVCSATEDKNFKSLGTTTSGPGFAKFMAIVCSWKTFMGCLSYSIVLGDSFPAVFASLGAPEFLEDRTTVILGVTGCVVLPLCLLRDLSILSYTSLAGIFAMLYTTVFVLIRYSDGSYAPGGRYYSSTKDHCRPDFSSELGLWQVNITTLVLLCSLAVAFNAHVNAPKFYSELRQRSVRRFNFVVGVSFMIAAAVFVTVMLAGYYTFGCSTQGMLLNNYSSDDHMATVARLGVGCSIVFTYPLMFTGFRDGVISLLGVEATPATSNTVTVSLLSVVTTLSLFLRNLGFINSFDGAIFGVLVCYIFPATIMSLAMRKKYIFVPAVEGVLVKALIGAGCILMALGGSVAYLQEFKPDALKR